MRFVLVGINVGRRRIDGRQNSLCAFVFAGQAGFSAAGMRGFAGEVAVEWA
jgi:hypothetical protein